MKAWREQRVKVSMAQSTYLSIYLFILFVYLCIYLFIYFSLSFCIYSFASRLFIYLSIDFLFIPCCLLSILVFIVIY
jgi:hypothetical protein